MIEKLKQIIDEYEQGAINHVSISYFVLMSKNKEFPTIGLSTNSINLVIPIMPIIGFVENTPISKALYTKLNSLITIKKLIKTIIETIPLTGYNLKKILINCNNQIIRLNTSNTRIHNDSLLIGHILYNTSTALVYSNLLRQKFIYTNNQKLQCLVLIEKIEQSNTFQVEDSVIEIFKCIKFYTSELNNLCLKMLKEEAHNIEDTLKIYYQTSKVVVESSIKGIYCNTNMLDNTLKLKYSSVLKKITNNMYYPKFNLTSTITGRLGSEYHTFDKTLKSIIESRWKSEGGIILSVDFKQIELRVLASISKDSALLNVLNSNIDPHMETAKTIYKKQSINNSDERQSGKTLNFAMIYGATPYAVSKKLKIETDKATEMFNNFYETYLNVGDWITKQKEMVFKTNTITTPYNRTIPIEDSYYNEAKKQDSARRKAVNYTIQSTTTSYVLECINKLYKHIKANNLKSLIIGSVQDSVQLDVYPKEALEIIHTIKNIFENIDNDWLKCKTPLDFNINNLPCSVKKSNKDETTLNLINTGKALKIFEGQLQNCYFVKKKVKQILKHPKNVKPLIDVDFKINNNNILQIIISILSFMYINF